MPLHLDGKSKPGPLGTDWQRVALGYEARIAELETAIKKAADIIDRNLYRQAEKVEDASLVLKAALAKTD